MIDNEVAAPLPPPEDDDDADEPEITTFCPLMLMVVINELLELVDDKEDKDCGGGGAGCGSHLLSLAVLSSDDNSDDFRLMVVVEAVLLFWPSLIANIAGLVPELPPEVVEDNVDEVEDKLAEPPPPPLILFFTSMSFDFLLLLLLPVINGEIKFEDEEEEVEEDELLLLLFELPVAPPAKVSLFTAPPPLRRLFLPRTDWWWLAVAVVVVADEVIVECPTDVTAEVSFNVFTSGPLDLATKLESGFGCCGCWAKFPVELIVVEAVMTVVVAPGAVAAVAIGPVDIGLFETLDNEELGESIDLLLVEVTWVKIVEFGVTVEGMLLVLKLWSIGPEVKKVEMLVDEDGVVDTSVGTEVDIWLLPLLLLAVVWTSEPEEDQGDIGTELARDEEVDTEAGGAVELLIRYWDEDGVVLVGMVLLLGAAEVAEEEMVDTSVVDDALDAILNFSSNAKKLEKLIWNQMIETKS